ncbi:MAG: hypothetical protein ACI4EN_05105 [Butyrivibrio sp.]
MEKPINIYEGKYGVRECLLALKKQEEGVLVAKVKELEAGIADQLAERDALTAERDSKKDQIEREYAIRINNNNRDIDKCKNSLADLENQQKKLKQELAECSFVAVGKKKTLNEKIAENEAQIAKINNNLRVAETTAKELVYGKEKNLARLDSGLNRLQESMKDVTDQIDGYNESIAKLRKAQEEYTSLSDYDIHKLLNEDEVFKDYVYSLLRGTEKGLTVSELQHRNVIFALIPDARLNDILKELTDTRRITRRLEGDNAYFSAND